MALVTFSASAQIQQAWVARYNNGITNGTNQAVKMVLGPAGNIYVTGFSQNADTNLGYVTINYAPNGNQFWASRFDSTNYPSATPTALALDSSNDVFVTGSALTVKYDPNGNQLWTAPYAGTALAVDTYRNLIVTGISATFGTVKLNPSGSNLWLATYPSTYGLGIAQQVITASDSSIYVAGNYTFNCDTYGCYHDLLLIKYTANGSQLWTTQWGQGQFSNVQIAGAVLDSTNNLYLVGDFFGGPGTAFITFNFTTDGAMVWTAYPDNGTGPATGLALDRGTNIVLVGQDAYKYNGDYSYYYSAFKLNSAGATMWTNHYPQPPFGSSAATSIALDSASNAYVTGYSPGTNTANDIVTIKYDPNGNQIWLQRYASPGNGNAAGNAIAVDNNGNVYVTGYDTTPAGGTEIVTIKYSPVTLQRRSDGTVILQAQGSPGETFDIEASENLLNWLDLGIATADTNGLMQFEDTNAPNYPARFYYTSPQ